jgi:hypothetical protein
MCPFLRKDYCRGAEQELVAELHGLGAEAIFVRTDVRKDEDVRNLVD